MSPAHSRERRAPASGDGRAVGAVAMAFTLRIKDGRARDSHERQSQPHIGKAFFELRRR